MKQPEELSTYSKKSYTAVILAAGVGSRMNTVVPKPLQPICGAPILQHILHTVERCGIKKVCIVYKKDYYEQFLKITSSINLEVSWALQKESLGTAHALQQALPKITTQRTLILLGDAPFTPQEIIEKSTQSNHLLTVITAKPKDPTGLGRIIRGAQGQIQKIIEEKDLDETQKRILEINTGIMVAETRILRDYLPKVNRENEANEYHMTALIQLLVDKNPESVGSIEAQQAWEVSGVNTLHQLISLEKMYMHACARKHLSAGVEIKDPARFDCRGSLTCGENVTIDINVIIEGTVKIGNNCRIGASCILKNVTIGDNVSVLPFSSIEETILKKGAQVGPFAFCRKGTFIEENAQLGCFVETKSTKLGKNSKAKHLSYLGNLTVQKNCNIGAGFIHCNYDGRKKHTSTIGENSFVGANSEVIGPVDIQKNTTVAAGATITKTIPESALAISRVPQKNIVNWQKQKKSIEKNTEKI